MANSEKEHYDRESFVVAYNGDQRLQNLVSSFDEQGIVLPGGEAPKSDDDKGADTVDKMAKSATKDALK